MWFLINIDGIVIREVDEAYAPEEGYSVVPEGDPSIAGYSSLSGYVLDIPKPVEPESPI